MARQIITSARAASREEVLQRLEERLTAQLGPAETRVPSIRALAAGEPRHG